MPDQEPFRALRSQGYHLVGRHSAVKTCHWAKEAIAGGEMCYKGKFYGISSHRCLQMSPAVAWCTNMCSFCWRLLPKEHGLDWDGARIPEEDDPVELAEGVIRAHRKAVNGFKSHPKVTLERYGEAMAPNNVAISLSGEPTAYSKLDSLIGEFSRRGMTTFLVSNGTNPEALGRLREPTQLYISLGAPSEEVYRSVCRPTREGSWESLMKSLSMLQSFRCPTVVRLTAAKGLNMIDPDGFARIISSSMPTYVEVKAYMHVGFSTTRLGYGCMPSHDEILAFAKELAARTGYELVGDVPISRVALLSRIGKAKKVA